MKGHVATLIAVLSALACAQADLAEGPCPNKAQPMANYELAKYAGRWYEVSSYGLLSETLGKCIQATYTPNSDGGVDVKNVMVEKITGLTLSVKGSAQQVQDGSNSGKLAVTLNIAGANRTSTLYVLGTDYENYSVVYSCRDFGLFHYDYGWVLSRQSDLSEKQEETVQHIITSNGLDASKFAARVQDCGVVDF